MNGFESFFFFFFERLYFVVDEWKKRNELWFPVFVLVFSMIK